MQRERLASVGCRNGDRYIPEAFRRQPQELQVAVVVERRVRVGRGGQHRLRHVTPQKILERPHVLPIDRIFRQHQHAVLPFVPAEADGIARLAGPAIVVEIATAGPARVHRCGEVMWKLNRFAAILADCEILRLKELCRLARWIVIELVDEHDVRADTLNYFRDVLRLRVIAGGQFPRELARFIPK